MAKNEGKGGSLDTRDDSLKDNVNVTGIDALVSIGLLSAGLKFICSQHLLIRAFGLKMVVMCWGSRFKRGGEVIKASAP